jgi:glutamate--cysteine ligase
MATQLGDASYRDAVNVQQKKVDDPSSTPSAQVLAALDQGRSFHEFGLKTSQAHTEHFRATGLTAQEQKIADQMRDQSLSEQAAIEASDTISFAQYVENFHAALQAPQPAR